MSVGARCDLHVLAAVLAAGAGAAPAPSYELFDYGELNTVSIS